MFLYSRTFYAFIFALCVTYPLFLSSQNNMPSQALEVKTLNEKYQGLITDIHTDTSNYTWILSSRNVLRFDGLKIKKYYPANFNATLAIEFFNDAFGRLWTTDYGGSLAYVQGDSLYAYPHNDSTKHLTYRGAYEMIEYDEDSVMHIASRDRGYFKMHPDGTLEEVIGKDSGLRGYMALIRKDKPPFIFSIGGYKGEKKKARYFYLMNPDLSIRDSLPITYKGTRHHSSMVELGKNNFLFASGMKNLVYFSKEHIERSVEFEHPIVHLFCDSEKGIWIGTERHGVQHFSNPMDLSKGGIVYYDEQTACAYTEDLNGGIWMKSSKHGVCFIPDRNFRYFSRKEGLNQNAPINALYATSKFAYIASDSIIHRLDRNGTLQRLPNVFKETGPLRSYVITMLYHDSLTDKLWVGGLNFLAFYKNNQWKSLNIKEHWKYKGIIRGLERSPLDTGITNIILNNLLLQFRGDSLINEVNTNGKNIRATVTTPDGKTWIGSADGLGVLENGVYTHYGTKHDYFNFDVGGLFYYANRLWIRIGSSLIYMDANDSVHFTSKSLSIDYLFPHEDNGFWIHSCCSGVVHCYVDDNDSIVYEGYSTSKSISLSYSKTSFQWGDTLFLGSSTGLHMGVISQLDSAKPKTHLVLDKVLINSKGVALKRVYDLNYQQNYLQVNFNSINFEPDENGTLFRYKMLGLKDEWYETREHFAQFTALDPGEYTFQLQAKSDWTDYGKVISVKFNIEPPFWQTLWFRAAGILLLVLLIVLIFRYTLNAQKKKDRLIIDKLLAQQKALRAQLNPHFIFNSLSSIQEMVVSNDKLFATENIAVFAKLMRKVLMLSEKEWIPLTEEIEVLELYLEVESLRFEQDFGYNVELSEQLKEHTYQVPSLLLQPLVENAIKHGALKRKESGARVTLRGYKTDDHLCLEVEDNGPGLAIEDDDQNGHTSFGIFYVQKRIELLNTSLKVKITCATTTSPDDGTRVLIQLPLDLAETGALKIVGQ